MPGRLARAADESRDATVVGQVRLHRLLRRGATYGPPLAEGVLGDDGADRGLMFAAVNANLKRQFEFVQAQWVNDGKLIGAPDEHDPLVAPHDEHGQLAVPRQPIRRRLQGLPTFVVNRGGEYCFIPGAPGDALDRQSQHLTSAPGPGSRVSSRRYPLRGRSWP
jgi:deferrochelatase/peroxidase EfeB